MNGFQKFLYYINLSANICCVNHKFKFTEICWCVLSIRLSCYILKLRSYASHITKSAVSTFLNRPSLTWQTQSFDSIVHFFLKSQLPTRIVARARVFQLFLNPPRATRAKDFALSDSLDFYRTAQQTAQIMMSDSWKFLIYNDFECFSLPPVGDKNNIFWRTVCSFLDSKVNLRQSTSLTWEIHCSHFN